MNPEEQPFMIQGIKLHMNPEEQTNTDLSSKELKGNYIILTEEEYQRVKCSGEFYIMIKGFVVQFGCCYRDLLCDSESDSEFMVVAVSHLRDGSSIHAVTRRRINHDQPEESLVK